jgi:type IV pilus assembly protein PilX
MNMNTQTKPKSEGFALFSVMMLLLALMVISMTFLRTSSLNERMVGNDLDRSRAYQIAEATIRDAQRDILHLKADGNSCLGLNPCRAESAFGNSEAGLGDLPPGCNAGICLFTIGEYRAAQNFVGPWEPTSPFAANFAQYGQWSGAQWTTLSAQLGTNITLAQQPRYWIEILPMNAATVMRYRITARAWGVNPNTMVTLQEIFQPSL